MLADTQITALGCGLYGGYAIPFNRRSLRWGKYFTRDSAIRLNGYVPVIRHYLRPGLPDVGLVVNHRLDASGLYLTITLTNPAIWPDLPALIAAGEAYFCPIGTSAFAPNGVNRLDPVDLWVERFTVGKVMLTQQPCFIKADYGSPLAYLSAELDAECPIPPGLNPIIAAMPMERT